MKTVLLVPALLLGLLSLPAAETPQRDPRCYEMRTYHAAAGKFAEMHARFRQHTCALFEKHGMVNIGYFVPTDDKDGATNKLVYFLAYPSREARERSWKAFMADPAWQAAYQASETNGKLVAKAESRFLQATDYSPEIRSQAGSEPRVFELRIYTASPGNLGHLNARFREHTVRLFEKHGIANIAYWTPAPNEPGAEDTLIYLVAHKSRAAAAESFKAFAADPAWQAARKASEDQAGGPLTVKDGVKSVFLEATDYSPLR